MHSSVHAIPNNAIALPESLTACFPLAALILNIEQISLCLYVWWWEAEPEAVFLSFKRNKKKTVNKIGVFYQIE